VKVGGSLFDWPELPMRLAAFLNQRRASDRDQGMVLIAGGGPVAEAVRSLDRLYGLGDDIAHQLALAAMDISALCLARLVSDPVLAATSASCPDLVSDPFLVRAACERGSIPVLAARALLERIERYAGERLPASWDITSDSIAARIASFLEADRLILLKSASMPGGGDAL
jgi:aspartokinase-like uncharacterized kinase